MSDASVNGLRLLAVETSILLGLTICLFVVSRWWRPGFPQPRWLNRILASRRLAVLFVIAAALIGRALLMPLFPVPQPRHRNRARVPGSRRARPDGRRRANRRETVERKSPDE